jgi:hypothetical protein
MVRPRDGYPKRNAVKPRTGRKKWSANRINTLPAGGDAPESREVAPEAPTVGDAIRQAMEALGDVTIDESQAARQLRVLAELYEEVAEAQAAYDAKAEEAKTAKKGLEGATNELLEQVRAFTHGKAATPLFDETDEDLKGETLRPGTHAEH